MFTEFWKIFAGTAFGFPILIVVIDLTDSLQKYLDRNISVRHIALAYVYYLPESAFMVLPAAVLFATVFSVGGFTRHSEITAAKASGISFYRLVVPILLGATLATGLDLGLGELMPVTSRRRNELLGEELARVRNHPASISRSPASSGECTRRPSCIRTWEPSAPFRSNEKAKDRQYPTYVIAADSARYDARRERWTLRGGQLDIIPDTGLNYAISFAAARDAHFTEAPAALMANPPEPAEMRYNELRRFIEARERSGGDEAKWRVELGLKIAVPCACFIIALFGAPLATSTQRGGTAYGVAVSLATTVIFLLMIQLTQAVGEAHLVPPDYAAWLPDVIFGLIGLGLMARVKT